MVNDLRVGRQHLVTDALNYWYVHNVPDAGTNLGIPGFTADTTLGSPGIPVFSIPDTWGSGMRVLTGSNKTLRGRAPTRLHILTAATPSLRAPN